VGCLEAAEALDQPVVTRIGGLRPVENVVQIVVMPDLLAEALDLLGRRGSFESSGSARRLLFSPVAEPSTCGPGPARETPSSMASGP
jgi:hypothetical protein